MCGCTRSSRIPAARARRWSRRVAACQSMPVPHLVRRIGPLVRPGERAVDRPSARRWQRHQGKLVALDVDPVALAVRLAWTYRRNVKAVR
jgi:hypothetical protein